MGSMFGIGVCHCYGHACCTLVAFGGCKMEGHVCGCLRGRFLECMSNVH